MIHYVFDLDDTIVMHYTGRAKPYNEINEDKNLSLLLEKCNGPRYIYTNGTGGHAIEVIKRMKQIHLFDKIYSRDTIPYMKPDLRSFNSIHDDISQRYPGKHKVFFFDDLLENLKIAKSIGWITFWINPNSSKGYPSFVDGGFTTLEECLVYLQNN